MLSSDQMLSSHLKNDSEYRLKYATLVDMLLANSQNREKRLIFMDMRNTPQPISYAELADNARTVASYLMARGLEKNDKVVLMMPTCKEFVYIFFGILLAGGIPVPTSQPAGSGHRSSFLAHIVHIILDCEAKFAISYKRMETIVGLSDEMQWINTDFIISEEIFDNAAAHGESRDFPPLSIDDVALLQYTSGTTSLPKGVVLTHKNLLHNMHAISVACGTTKTDVSLSWLPLYHDMGLTGALLSAIYGGITLVLMRPESFIFRPQWWLENIGRFNVTICVAPNFGYHYCTTRIADPQCGQFALASWRIALNGAEPIDQLTLQKFYCKFKSCGLRPDVFVPVYGMAENSLAVTFPSLEEPTVVRRLDRQQLEERQMALDASSNDPLQYVDLVSVGAPILGQEVRIADAEGRTLPEREVGEILVRSVSLTQGYYNNVEATEKAIKNGWLHTGDLGFVLDRRLFVSGRIKEMIIKRGRNIFPYDVERTAATVDGIRMGASAAFAVENHDTGTEDLVLVCETLTKVPEEIAAIKKKIDNTILATLGYQPDHIIITEKGTVPKTTSGKVQRLTIKKMYLDGTLFEKEIGISFQPEDHTAFAAPH